MSSFFMSTIKARLDKNKSKYPLLKVNDLLDWELLGNQLRLERFIDRGDNRGNQGYDALKMFKAILLGQWHSLSDPELEHALAVRADFMVFCDFDDMELPDHSTLCRYRHWLMKKDRLPRLLSEVNRQLEQNHLKVSKAKVAVVDASIIESRGTPTRKAIEQDDATDEIVETPPSKDSDATWVKKAGKFYLGYKLHARSDTDGYLDGIHVTAANAHESNHLAPLTADCDMGTRVLADKGYHSKANRLMLKQQGLKDGIMYKAVRGKPLTSKQKQANRLIKTKRYVVEQSFGTLKRRFQFTKAKYFGLDKLQGQCYLKAMCLNLLKASNKVQYV